MDRHIDHSYLFTLILGPFILWPGTPDCLRISDFVTLMHHLHKPSSIRSMNNRAILFLAIPLAIGYGCKTSDNPITPITPVQKTKYAVQYTVVNTGDASLWSFVIYALIYSRDEGVTTFDADAFNGVSQYDSLYIKH